MEYDNSIFYKCLILRNRKKFLKKDNFTNWFSDKNNRNPVEGGGLRNSSYYLSGEYQCNYNENDIHSKAKILQYLLDLDHALILIRKGKYGICINCSEEIPIYHLEEFPNTRQCPRCE